MNRSGSIPRPVYVILLLVVAVVAYAIAGALSDRETPSRDAQTAQDSISRLTADLSALQDTIDALKAVSREAVERADSIASVADELAESNVRILEDLRAAGDSIQREITARVQDRETLRLVDELVAGRDSIIVRQEEELVAERAARLAMLDRALTAEELVAQLEGRSAQHEAIVSQYIALDRARQAEISRAKWERNASLTALGACLIWC